MNLLESTKDIFTNTPEFVKSKNFYFETHDCEVTGENVKVNFDYSLLDEITEDKLIFGQCPHCKKTFYNFDWE